MYQYEATNGFTSPEADGATILARVDYPGGGWAETRLKASTTFTATSTNCTWEADKYNETRDSTNGTWRDATWDYPLLQLDGGQWVLSLWDADGEPVPVAKEISSTPVGNFSCAVCGDPYSGASTVSEA